MVKSYSRGHEIYYDGLCWKYLDTDEMYDDSRPCVKCDCYPTSEGYDACTGHVEGAVSVCCGHDVEDVYMVLEKEE